MPPENVLEGWYKTNMQGSEQLQKVYAMYKKELNRDQAAPNYQKLRRMVKQHVDQTRNARIETGVLVQRQKGRNVSAERKVGDCYQWKANGQCSK